VAGDGTSLEVVEVLEQPRLSLSAALQPTLSWYDPAGCPQAGGHPEAKTKNSLLLVLISMARIKVHSTSKTQNAT